MIRYERVEPRAAMLIESMRDLGYSLKTALADIIDNAITADAQSIKIFADTNNNCQLTIVDDGCGMDETEILAAMRPGSSSPFIQRKSTDLGRFGLGLKTASFSQCRRLTVLSRKNGRTSCATWDLDEVVKADDWLIEMTNQTSDIPLAEHLGEHGTLIQWQKLDRLVGANSNENAKQAVQQIDEAAEHLQLVFHRFLDGEKGLKKINITLNNRRLDAFDPFHTKHTATQIQPLEPEPLIVNGHLITIQGFTLPHHKKVSPAIWEHYGGREGYVKNQGFYVYRGKRLIIYGTWFGLARQTELTKLARVRIDIPNGLDAEWKIDVKKSSAQPPAIVRTRLRKLIETIGANSRRVYTARGRKLVNDSRLPVWARLQDKNEISYCLNSEHPVFSDFTMRLPDDMRKEFSRILELASSAIPIDSLFADISGTPDQVFNTEMSRDSLMAIVETTFTALIARGLRSSEIRDMLSVTEPFRSRWQETKEQLSALDNGSTSNE
jgi:hypothetical protein